MAKPVGQGLKDLVLMPSHLGLTIHEIVAHATEVDRIAGYEANYAGTSFVKIADVGKLKYGSKHVQRHRRSHVPDRHGHRRLRRRRREGAEVAAGEGRHPGRPADQPRDRAPRRREGKPRLHVREPLAQLSVPADAERPARAGAEGIADRRSDDRRRQGRRAGRRRRAASASTSSATTASSAATRSGRSRTARRRAW